MSQTFTEPRPTTTDFSIDVVEVWMGNDDPSSEITNRVKTPALRERVGLSGQDFEVPPARGQKPVPNGMEVFAFTFMEAFTLASTGQEVMVTRLWLKSGDEFFYLPGPTGVAPAGDLLRVDAGWRIPFLKDEANG